MSSIAVETREVWSVFALVRIIQIDVKVDGPISIECLVFSFQCAVLSVQLSVFHSKLFRLAFLMYDMTLMSFCLFYALYKIEWRKK